MNLINLSESNYQEYTDKFVKYYRFIKNELFELEKGTAMDEMEVGISSCKNNNYYENYKWKTYIKCIDLKYFHENEIVKEFRYLCKHGVLRTLTKYSKCRYQTNNLFYRILMPFKEEDINTDPLIKIYHDVLYNDEILKIKTMSLANVRILIGLNKSSLLLSYLDKISNGMNMGSYI